MAAISMVVVGSNPAPLCPVGAYARRICINNSRKSSHALCNIQSLFKFSFEKNPFLLIVKQKSIIFLPDFDLSCFCFV